MRFIIHGVGAVGGTIAAELSRAGHEVLGIARGAQLEALRSGGLTLRTPDGTSHARFPCVAAPDEIAFRPDDAIFLCMKTQDTMAALQSLRAAGVTDQPVFCTQNGIENERMAQRIFPDVHGITVLLPAQFLVPGEVACFGTPKVGLLDIGRFPSGIDDTDRAVAAAFAGTGIEAQTLDDVMRAKNGKLLVNLANIVGAAFGDGADTKKIKARVQAEGEAVLTAAGFGWDDVMNDPRRETHLRFGEVAGVDRAGSSSAQSLARAAGSIETDYLNGEIALLGRLHGVPTPANSWLAALAARLVREGSGPGSVPVEAFTSAMRGA
ncbi:ketopantoate reductase family protein [Acidimangrovimonas sediminis]|uniref:ketopantoate reductase family protein n=1 Tax=Acidimangrovimonas sediminis TaxID=2056283 RepID=UPI000C80C5A9|nr:2-dehydropantoate 2-reductase N-terminal domain-containing protein [Acidimangrovimonas sediminis]